LVLVGAAAIIAGCAGFAPSDGLIGLDREAVVKSLGQPEREYAAEGKSTLHFPQGPAGVDTYFVYLGEDGRVVGWDQVLTEQRFSEIFPGMTKEHVIELVGISKITHGLIRQRGYAWHYRYFNHQCKSFAIEFTTDHVVRNAGYITRSGRRCNNVGAA
jgi:hypothetical protein